MPTAHPRARLCRRRKGAKGDKRYAAACKQIVGKPHTATKNASMLPCRATSPTARPAPPTETGKKKEMAFGQGVVVTGG